ncbi:MAG TPA: disulfide bond formation protein B [Planctomycetaceae bacterium]|nr:disulfide bond formation protein B [Planctomycetaceae bacterium]
MKYAVAALGLAIAGTIGSLFLSLGMGLKACPLCFYQRAFIMAAAAVLGVGLLADRGHFKLLCLISIPLAAAGLTVAAFHEYLVLTGVLECPKALLGLGTAPAQSLIIFVALLATVVAGAKRKPPVIGAALILGLLIAWGSIASAPPLPPAPKQPYDPATQPLDMCRPVFRGA